MQEYAQTSDGRAVLLDTDFVKECGYLTAITEACSPLDFIPVPFPSKTVSSLQQLTLTLLKRPLDLHIPLSFDDHKQITDLWVDAGLTGQNAVDMLAGADFLGAHKVCDFLCALMAVEFARLSGPKITKSKQRRLHTKYPWAGSYLL